MTVPLHRRSFLGLLAATALAGCNALDSSATCSLDPGGAVDGWPLPGRDPQNTHAVPDATPPTLEDLSILWTVDWNRELYPILISGEMLLVADKRVASSDPSDQDPPPTVVALDPATGDRRWRADVIDEEDPGLSRLGRSAAIGTDRVYVVQERIHSTPNRLLAFDRSTGERAWAHEGIRSDGLHLGAGVVLAATEEAVRVVDPATGEACRTVHLQGPVARWLDGRNLSVRPAVVGDRLFLVSAEPRETPEQPLHYWLSGVDLASGQERWTSDRFTSHEDRPQAVVADGDRVYLPVGNRIQAFDHDGNLAWRQPVTTANPEQDGWPYVWRMALAGSRLVVELATYEAPNEYYGLDAATGAVDWQRTGLWRQPVAAGDVLYAQRTVDADGDGLATELHAVDAASGETRTTRRFEGILESPPRVADGRLFAMVDAAGQAGASRYRLAALA